MKKSIIGIVSIVSAVVFMACGSAPSAKVSAKKAKSAGNHAEYIDWQGLAAGGDLPDWYSAVLNAKSESSLRKALSEDGDDYKNYRLWAVNATGENLEAIKTMTDSFNIQSAVSASIAQNVAQVADRQRDLEGAGSAITQESKAQVVDMISKNVTLNGLERITSYWAQYEILNKKGVVVKPAVYSYVLVMGMSQDRFNAQLDAAMQKIDENTNQDENLRALASLAIARLRDPESVNATVNANIDIRNNNKLNVAPAAVTEEAEAILY